MARTRLRFDAPGAGGDRAPVAKRLRVVGVMGSGTEPHADRAHALGRWLGSLPVHLLTGGGGGVMAAVSRAFHEAPRRRGSVIGVLPAAPGGGPPGAPQGYPNPWVEIAVRTHLPLVGARGAEALSRNPINVLTSDVIVALPGSHGTASEAALALRYGRPIIAFVDGPEQIEGLPAGVRIEPDLARVQDFVREQLGLT